MTLPLPKQVSSLELSKRLRELGVPQESLFCIDSYGDIYDRKRDRLDECETYYAAFTCSELGEMFPHFWTIKWQRGGGNFLSVTNEENGINYHDRDIETEVDARAKMLIFLLENGLITLKK